MKRAEQEMQKGCVKWFKHQYPNLILFHCPNGGKRTLAESSIFKAMGVVPGIADLCLLYHGRAYFFELKSDKGKMSDAQIDFAAYCVKHEIPHCIIQSFDEFKKEIESIVNVRG